MNESQETLLFHATRPACRDSIAARGLVPSPSGLVYLSEKPESWQDETASLVLAVPLSALQARGLRLTTFADPELDEVLCWGRVPPEDLLDYDFETGLTLPLVRRTTMAQVETNEKGEMTGLRDDCPIGHDASLRNPAPITISRPIEEVPAAIPLPGTADDYELVTPQGSVSTIVPTADHAARYQNAPDRLTAKARQLVADHVRQHPGPAFDVFVVWQCHLLGNRKWLLATTLSDGRYYEVTWNGQKSCFYLDAYQKIENRKIDVTPQEVGS